MYEEMTLVNLTKEDIVMSLQEGDVNINKGILDKSLQ